jgi:hypothetical protein
MDFWYVMWASGLSWDLGMDRLHGVDFFRFWHGCIGLKDWAFDLERKNGHCDALLRSRVWDSNIVRSYIVLCEKRITQATRA